MSYGVDQTRANTLRVWLIVVSVLMVIGLATAFFVSRAYIRYKQEQEELLLSRGEVVDGGGAVPLPSSTPEPTATMTALPTMTTTATTSPSGTPQPASTATPGVNKDVFPYSVTEILYLSESYNRGRYWKPGDAIADNVSEANYQAIYDLLWAVHVQREQVFLTETFPDYGLLNDGYAITQLQNYYSSSINKNDGCTTRISIVNDQFRVFIIEFDGTTARTMTVKVENRVDSCGVKTASNDYFGYENLVRVFYAADGKAAWKVIEHTANMGVK